LDIRKAEPENRFRFLFETDSFSAFDKAKREARGETKGYTRDALLFSNGVFVNEFADEFVFLY